MKPSPIELLTTELSDSARLSATGRYLLKKRLLAITREARIDPSVLARTSEEILSIINTMTTACTAVSKLLLGPKGPGTGDDSTSPERVLEDFVKGTKPKP